MLYNAIVKILCHLQPAVSLTILRLGFIGLLLRSYHLLFQRLQSHRARDEGVRRVIILDLLKQLSLLRKLFL